ncbi:MAG: polysaccharide deacetylase [Parcubacteria group bacterium]|nr:polysaccharide deacetylase [Parcubacteria group bacterium]
MRDLRIFKRGTSELKRIVLTFDDGPNPYATPEILDILRRENCKAAFFLIGDRAESYPEIVKRIVDEGHTIGGHTQKHGGSDGKEPYHEFLLGNRSIEKISRKPVHYIRVPQLMYNAVDNGIPRVKELYEQPLREKNLRNEIIVADCSIITHDWFIRIPIWLMLLKVKIQLHNGAIINMHDGSENTSELKTRAVRTVRMLPTLIQQIRARGFEIVDISELEPVFIVKEIRTL